MAIKLAMLLLSTILLKGCYTSEPLVSDIGANSQYSLDGMPENQYYENNKCLMRTNYTFGETANGELQLVAYSCDLPPSKERVGGDYKYLFPTESRIKIMCRSDPNNTCVKRSHHLWGDNHTNVEGEQLNDYETEFTIDFIQPFESRMWLVCYCNGTDGKRHHVGPLKMIYSNYVPRPVTDFDCIVHDFKDAECRWDDQSELNVSWTACVGLRNQTLNEPVLQCTSNFSDISEGDLKGHLWFVRETKARTPNSSYHDCGYRPDTKITIPSAHWQGRYVAIFNGTNQFGVTTSSFNFTMDQVQISKASVTLLSVGSKEIVLKYNHNCGLNPSFKLSCFQYGLNYKLTFAINETLTPDFENIHRAKKRFSITETYKGNADLWVEAFQDPFTVNVTTLMPYTNYILTVVQRIGDSKLWSEPTIIEFRTSSIVPSRGPFVHPTGFVEEGTCKDGRLVNIYWKGLGIHNGGNGVVTGYQLNDLLQPAQMREASQCLSMTESTVSINATNEIGKGSTPSSLIVPSSKNKLNIPTCLLRARTVRDETDKVLLNWELLTQHLLSQNITDANYTIFWCKLEANMCQEEFDWMDATNHNSSEYVLQMKHNRTEYKYGISVSQGTLRSGITWADCLLGFAGASEEDVSIRVTRINNTRARVIVTPKCTPDVGMLEKTDFVYCQNGDDQSCKKEAPTLGHCLKEYEVTLKPGMEYSFSLTREYKGSPGLLDGPRLSSFVLTNKDEAKQKAIVYVGVTAGVVAFVVIISCAIYYIIRKKKQSKKLTVTTIRPTDMGFDDNKIEPDMESLCSNEHTNSYVSYKVAGPVSTFSPQHEEDENNRHIMYNSAKEETSEKTRLMHQLSIESEIPTDSDYETGNSGNSLMGYSKMPDQFSVPKDGVEQFDSGELYLADDINSASSDGSLFHGATLEDIMKQKSSLQTVKEEDYPEPNNDYMAVTEVLTKKCNSAESMQTPMNSGYVKVDRINVGESCDSNNQLSDDYVQVHSTDANQKVPSSLEKAQYGNTKYADVMPMKEFAGDLTSAATINTFSYDLDESGTSAIDMSQFLKETYT